MAEISLPPLFAHAPESNPPLRWRLLLLPAILSILGMLIALAATTTGQDERRARDTLRLHYDLVYWENQLAQAKLAHKSDAEIQPLEETAARFRAAQNFPPWKYGYSKYGRQFTPWDGYRYEQIVEDGYAYHLPDDPQDVKDASSLQRPGWPEARIKNVVWYPLYPLLGYIVSHTLNISANHALTVVSWICCLLGSVVTFLYARRHFFNRMPALDLSGSEVALAAEAHPARRWDLSPQDSAALWVVAALLFGPCSIFLYANFTESLFVLLLACFLYCLQSRWWWRAALVAAVASACRSQGVLFGPVLALTFLLRDNRTHAVTKLGIAYLLGVVAAIGLACYAIFLYSKFHDPLAFMHAQTYWNVGISWDRIAYAANPVHAMTQFLSYAFYRGEVDWPRLWEAACLIWPPIVLLIFGGRYLSFELEVLGWILWGLPYVSNSMAGNPPFDTQWMSMGRFMAVMIPLYIISGAIFVRLRWLGLAFIVLWASTFSLFAFKYGNGSWVG